MQKIGVINYGAGNFSSVWNALNFLEIPCAEVRDSSSLAAASKIILPGVGAFKNAMVRLEEMKLIEPLRNLVLNDQLPFLGICVGHQVLATIGKEFEDYSGLGLVDGEVDQIQGEKIVLPHMGWNEVEPKPESKLFQNIPDPCFYFAHSYSIRLKDEKDAAAYCDYGERLVAAIEKKNIFGVQFDPEKSQWAGLQLLRNFSNL